MTEEPILKFPRGTVIQFTTGAYSDFQTAGLIVAVEEIDLPALAGQMRAEFKPKHQWDNCDRDEFAAWLIAKGFAMPVAVSEVHLGDYGWSEELGGEEDD